MKSVFRNLSLSSIISLSILIITSALIEFKPYCRNGTLNNEIINIAEQDTYLHIDIEDVIDGYNMTYSFEQEPVFAVWSDPGHPVSWPALNDIKGDVVAYDAYLHISQAAIYALVQHTEDGEFKLYFETVNPFTEKPPKFSTPVLKDNPKDTECHTVTILSLTAAVLGCWGKQTPTSKPQTFFAVASQDPNTKIWAYDYSFFDFDPTWVSAGGMKVERIYDESTSFGNPTFFYLALVYPSLGIEYQDGLLGEDRKQYVYIYDVEYDLGNNKYEIILKESFVPQSLLGTMFAVLDITTSNNDLFILTPDFIINAEVTVDKDGKLEFNEYSFQYDLHGGTIGVFEDEYRTYIALVGYGFIQEYDWTNRKLDPVRLNVYQSSVILQGSPDVFFTENYLAVAGPGLVLVYQRGQTEFQDVTFVIANNFRPYGFYLFENDYAVWFNQTQTYIYLIQPPSLILNGNLIENSQKLTLIGESSNGRTTKQCRATLNIKKVDLSDRVTIHKTSQENNMSVSLNPGDNHFIEADTFFQGFNLSYSKGSFQSQESGSDYQFMTQQQLTNFKFAEGVAIAQDTIWMEAFQDSTFFAPGFKLITQDVQFKIYVQSCAKSSYTSSNITCKLDQVLTDDIPAQIRSASFGYSYGIPYLGFAFGTEDSNPANKFNFYNLKDLTKVYTIDRDGEIQNTVTDIDIIGDFVYFTCPLRKLIDIYRILPDGGLATYGVLGVETVDNWGLSEGSSFWKPINLHINVQASDRFFVELEDRLVIIDIADNQAHYVATIMLGGLSQDWSRMIAVEPDTIMIVEVDKSQTQRITEYNIRNPYFPVQSKELSKYDHTFFNPIIGATSKHSLSKNHTYIYLLGVDGGVYKILNYELGQPSVNSLAYSPNYDYIPSGRKPLMTVATTINMDYVIIIQGSDINADQQNYVCHEIPHVPYILSTAALPLSYRPYIATDKLTMTVSGGSGAGASSSSATISLTVNVVNNQNDVFINEFNGDASNNVLGTVTKDNTSISFSDAGWARGSYVGLEVLEANFTLRNKVDRVKPKEEFIFKETTQVVTDSENFIFAVNRYCSIFAYDGNNPLRNDTFSSPGGEGPQATYECLSTMFIHRVDNVTVRTFYIAENKEITNTWELFVVKWNVDRTQPDDQFLKFVLEFQKVTLNDLQFFPGQIQLLEGDQLFVLDDEPLNLGGAIGQVNFYKLDFTKTNIDSLDTSNVYQAGICDIDENFDIASFEIASVLIGSTYEQFLIVLDSSGLGLVFLPLDNNDPQLSCDFGQQVTITQLLGLSDIQIPRSVTFQDIFVLQITSAGQDLTQKRVDLLLTTINAAMYQFYVIYDPANSNIFIGSITAVYNNYGNSRPIGDVLVQGNQFVTQFYNETTKAFVIAVYEFTGLKSTETPTNLAEKVEFVDHLTSAKFLDNQKVMFTSYHKYGKKSLFKKQDSGVKILNGAADPIPLNTMVAGVNITHDNKDALPYNTFTLYTDANGNLLIGSISSSDDKFWTYQYQKNLTLNILNPDLDEYTQTITFRVQTDYGSNQDIVKLLKVEPSDDDETNFLWLWIVLAVFGGILVILLAVWGVQQYKQKRSSSTDYDQKPLVKDDNN